MMEILDAYSSILRDTKPNFNSTFTFWSINEKAVFKAIEDTIFDLKLTKGWKVGCYFGPSPAELI